MKKFEEIKSLKHDASGIDNPNEWLWETRGIVDVYYPTTLISSFKAMSLPVFLEKIDWTLLHRQKMSLIAVADEIDSKAYSEDIESIICLIETMQDYAVDSKLKTEKEVFVSLH